MIRRRQSARFSWCLPVLFALAAAGGQVSAAGDFAFQTASLEDLEGTVYVTMKKGSEGTGLADSSRSPLRIATRGRSPLYRASQGDTLVFMRRRETAESPSEDFLKLGEYEVPSGMSRALLVFSRDPDTSGVFRVEAIDLSDATRKEGHLFVYNASPFRIAVRLPDSVETRVAPGGEPADEEDAEGGVPLPPVMLLEATADARADFNKAASGAGPLLMADVRFQVGFKGEWRPLNRDLLAIRRNEIRMVLFGPPAVEGSHYLTSSAFSLDAGRVETPPAQPIPKP